MRRNLKTNLLVYLFIFIGAGLMIPACTNENSNRTLSSIHASYPDCFGCHRGFGAAGSVFNDYNGKSAARGVQINMVRISDNSVYTLPKTDGLGNFYTTNSISGTYMMYAGEVGKVRSSTLPHIFPEWRSCNPCHVPGGASVSGYPPPTGTIKWQP